MSRPCLSSCNRRARGRLHYNLMHASFGGSTRRRMFTLNLSTHAESQEEIEDLEKFISTAAGFFVYVVHSDIMRDGIARERMRHLRQPMDHEGHLPA